MWKSALILLCSLTLGATTVEAPKKMDMFLFENPFLIGSWYVVNPSAQELPDDFLYIRLQLESNYRFTIAIKRKDLSTDTWKGDFTADDGTLTLGPNSQAPQIYSYNVNPSQLMLNGVMFIKTMPMNLAGEWHSTQITGKDVTSSQLVDIDLNLDHNFYFSIHSITDNGKTKYREGVYYIEDNNIYFIYKDGEQSSQFSIQSKQLVLSSTDDDMYIAFQKDKPQR
ncbi:hypothetical protein HC725_15710 [Vibrio sp. S17_S38]|uniref:lipocalin family protein n=1 Tax=Vibrio sp. S17_S38 TaxID=2720229 RepID=UPI001681219C|nr:lipocalin family protein [Vibrio sp. S17_S38]MBD1574699.1 hypothetical protein [Vibrio sp. S17_S38]